MTTGLDLLFPPFCPVCQARLGPARRDPLCGTCWEAIPRIEPPMCTRCGRPFPRVPAGDPGRPGDPALAPPALPAAGEALRCGACRLREPAFSYARAAAPYGEVVRAALHALKFEGRRSLARPLADLLADAGPARAVAGGADLLVPVPLHWRRRRDRGFNQAALLASALGRRWGISTAHGAMVRRVATPAQTELSADERRRNVRGAFAVERPQRVAGRHVILVDDVMTTGATVEACAVALRRAGAVTVGVLTVARAL